MSTEDDEYKGYFIPKRTAVIVNTWWEKLLDVELIVPIHFYIGLCCTTIICTQIHFVSYQSVFWMIVEILT